MKKITPFISLLAALAVGSASAATQAGTVIKNQAEITFTPEGSNTPTTTPSNPVETTVLPKPSFTITPNDDGAAGPTFPTENNLLKQSLVPGATAVFQYTLTNTGNVPNESYTLTTLTSSSTGAPLPTNVQYYLDADGNGVLSDAERAAGPITTISGVNQDAQVKFFQVYTVPTTTTAGQQLGADPVGTRNANPGKGLEPAQPYTQPKDDDNYNTVTVDRKDAVVIGPKDDADGNGNPTTAPYQSADAAPVTITPTANDTQVANAASTTTSVTFTNTVQNTGNRTDVFDITYVSTVPGATVTLLKPDGTPLTDTDGDNTPDVGPLAPGATADIRVKVTFSAGTAPAAPTTAPSVVVTATSSNDTTKKDPTTDIVNLPGLSFGDPTPTIGGDPAPVGTPISGQPGNPATPVDTTGCTNYVRTGLPMEVANLGSLPDSFDLSGTAPVKLTDGSTTNVAVKYFVDTNGNQILDGTEGNAAITNTGTLNPNQELKLIAVVDVPCAATAQTITVTQTAKSPTTGATVTDSNDTVTVGQSGKPDAVKTVDKTSAYPGDTLKYTVVGTNKSNVNVKNAKVCDALPAEVNFVSILATSTATGTIIYSANGGANWSATAPTSAPGKLCAAVDTNGDGTLSDADILKPGESVTVTITVTVK